MPKKKWEGLRKTSKRFDGNSTDRRTELNDRKDVYRHLDLKGLVEVYDIQRELKDKDEAKLKKTQLELDSIEELLLELMENQELESVSSSSGSTFSRSPSPYPIVKNKDALLAWLKHADLNELLSLNYQTLRGMVSERILEGESLPDGVELFHKETVRRRKG